MENIRVLPNQSFADIAIMHCGTMESAMEMMLQNDFSISDLPETSSLISIDKSRLVIDDTTVRYFQQNNIHPGTATGI